jgi:hypothetical protein
LLPAERSGLPRDFWGDAEAARVAEEMRALDTDTLPALRELILTILLTELDPPAGAEAERGAIFSHASTSCSISARSIRHWR